MATSTVDFRNYYTVICLTLVLMAFFLHVFLKPQVELNLAVQVAHDLGSDKQPPYGGWVTAGQIYGSIHLQS
jgi:hypothetical protein